MIPARKSPAWRASCLAALAAAAFSPSLCARGFIRDDWYIIAENALLRGWRLLPRLLSMGYWEGALGAAAPVQEYRPVLMLSYFLNRALLGAAPWGFHLVNALFHAGVVAALYLALRRRLEEPAALGAAVLFAVLPVHVEAVSYLAGRSEILALLFLLLSWFELEKENSFWRGGLLWYVLALLTKEVAVVFPFFLAASDWVWRRGRDCRRVRLHGALWVATIAAVALRFVVLGRPFHGGFDYFEGAEALNRALSVARFWTLHYVLPMAAGVGLQADFSRPLIPDSGPGDLVAWACLLGWIALAVATVEGIRRRRPEALLGLIFFLPLLPTSHLVIRLDTIGAERFLYIPSISFCVAAAWALRRRLILAGLLAALYAGQSLARQPAWLSDRSYAEAALRGNPVSAGAWSALGVCLAREGRAAEAEEALRRAVSVNPRHPAAYFNLGLLYYKQGRLGEADRMVGAATNGNSGDADAWSLRGLLAERRGAAGEALKAYARALELRPWDAVAHFNLGRLALASGRRDLAATHFREYLALAPDAEDAARIRKLVEAPLNP
ncbi:MAG: tetratricopeptide repeat protein [Elusimicrobia bacterium]|nr:tetratricopeptide repeat protein [Elusimicrobiota bacterium]